MVALLNSDLILYIKANVKNSPTDINKVNKLRSKIQTVGYIQESSDGQSNGSLQLRGAWHIR